jgi:hypothetical protein
MPEIPAPTHVLQALAPLWPPLYTALEWATQRSCTSCVRIIHLDLSQAAHFGQTGRS